jgi:hypothetical protein
VRLGIPLLTILLACPSLCRADIFDEDAEQPKDRPHLASAEAERKRDNELWAAYVKKLGKGPIYRVEVLFRGAGKDDHLYYCRHFISPDMPTPRGLFCIGVDDNGKLTPPYNPGQQEIKEANVELKRGSEAPLPPLARRSRHVGISLNSRDTKPESALVHISDLAVYMALPRKRGDVEYGLNLQSAFRLELVSAEHVLKAGPLRQDSTYFRERTTTLKQEQFTKYRDRFAEFDHEVLEMAYLFRDPELVAAVRKWLEDWLTRPEVTRKTAFPCHLLHCLANLGDERDFSAFQRLSKKRPGSAHNLTGYVLTLVERVGAAKAMSLLEDLVTNRIQRTGGRIPILRLLDPKIPERTMGDEFIREIVERFKLKPHCYSLYATQQKFELLTQNRSLTDDELKHWQDSGGPPYLFLSEADRKQGIELVLDFFKQYQPPAKK